MGGGGRDAEGLAELAESRGGICQEDPTGHPATLPPSLRSLGAECFHLNPTSLIREGLALRRRRVTAGAISSGGSATGTDKEGPQRVS